MVTRDALRKYHFKFATSVDLNEYLAEIKLPISLYTCAPISELPYNISSTINSLNLIWPFLLRPCVRRICTAKLSLPQKWQCNHVISGLASNIHSFQLFLRQIIKRSLGIWNLNHFHITRSLFFIAVKIRPKLNKSVEKEL